MLFLLCSFAFALQALLGALDLALEALDAEVVASGVVYFLLAVAGLAAGAGGVLDVACIALVVALLGLALVGHVLAEVNKFFAVVFYAHDIGFLRYKNVMGSAVLGFGNYAC